MGLNDWRVLYSTSMLNISVGVFFKDFPLKLILLYMKYPLFTYWPNYACQGLPKPLVLRNWLLFKKIEVTRSAEV